MFGNFSHKWSSSRHFTYNNIFKSKLQFTKLQPLFSYTWIVTTPTRIQNCIQLHPILKIIRFQLYLLNNETCYTLKSNGIPQYSFPNIVLILKNMCIEILLPSVGAKCSCHYRDD